VLPSNPIHYAHVANYTHTDHAGTDVIPMMS
jgi:hypothetical protein